MKSSLIIIAFFLLGIAAGKAGLYTSDIPVDSISMYLLYLLMVLIGLSFGSDPRLMEILRSINLKILLIPLSTVLGTFLGILLYNLLIHGVDLKDSLAIGSGFGYYSLSAILINKFSGEAMGILALLANIIREIFSLLFAPLLSRWFGKLAPIASAGATSMDTTLPVILKSSGKEYLIVSLLHGVALTILVPFIISFIYKVF
ncbi:MAG: lysine exporter LysO family protein [Bacteroidales bacterium]|nr:lysine exporter LysO family protein [Bacteroidales bacterium]